MLATLLQSLFDGAVYHASIATATLQDTWCADGGSNTVDVSVSGTGPSDRTYNALGVRPNASYSIQVAAVNSAGAVGPFSATITERTALPSKCEARTNTTELFCHCRITTFNNGRGFVHQAIMLIITSCWKVALLTKMFCM